MAVLDRGPERQIARIGGSSSARHDGLDLLIGRGAAVAMPAPAREKAKARDVRTMTAIICWQAQGQAVHKRIPSQRVERPLLGRNARRQPKAPAVALFAGTTLLMQQIEVV